MWCAHCQLDVPAQAVPEEPGVIRCAYCRQELASPSEAMPEPAAGAATIALAVAPALDAADSSDDELAPPRCAFPPPPDVNDWTLDADLRAAERMVRVLRQSHTGGAGAGEPWVTVEKTSASAAPVASEAGRPEAVEKAGLASWFCLTLGLMALVCGGVLLIWSLAFGRGDLWSIGLAAALAGQAGLVLGLVLQLDGLWQSNKRTERTLSDLDDQLGQLRAAASQLGRSHSGPSHSFYAHLAEGAGPQLLLSDLKGQLDLLAQQLARQSRAA
jgi:hypothetical protein